MAAMDEFLGDNSLDDDEIHPWLPSSDDETDVHDLFVPVFSPDSEADDESSDFGFPSRRRRVLGDDELELGLETALPWCPNSDYDDDEDDGELGFDGERRLSTLPWNLNSLGPADFERNELGLGLGVESEDDVEYSGLAIVGFDSETDPDDGCPVFDCGCSSRDGPGDEFEWEEVEETIEAVADVDDDGGGAGVIPQAEWEFLLSLRAADDDDDDDEGIALAEQDGFDKGNPPAAARVIETLPTVVLDRKEVCAVCKDEIAATETVKRLPCLHHYHGDCILPWLRIRNTCPVCRHELPTDDPEYEVYLAGGRRSSPLLHLIYEPSEVFDLL